MYICMFVCTNVCMYVMYVCLLEDFDVHFICEKSDGAVEVVRYLPEGVRLLLLLS